MAKKKRKQPKTKEKERSNRNKVILKTTIDVLIGGLISIGIYQSPTFTFGNLQSYIGISVFLILIITLMFIYSLKFGKMQFTTSILIVMIISFIEIYLIGILLNQEVEMILVVWFITIPSVIIFDNLLD